MKKNVTRAGSIQHPLRRTLMIMKLFIIFLFFALFQSRANDSNGQNVSVQVKSTEIRKVLTALEKQSQIRFLYNYELKALKTKVDFKVQNTPLLEALEQLLKGNGLKYKMVYQNLYAILSQNESENSAIR